MSGQNGHPGPEQRRQVIQALLDDREQQAVQQEAIQAMHRHAAERHSSPEARRQALAEAETAAARLEGLRLNAEALRALLADAT